MSMKRVFLSLFVLTLVGCANVPTGDDNCALPIIRDAGMGVMVRGCAAWAFGPSREQAARFANDHK